MQLAWSILVYVIGWRRYWRRWLIDTSLGLAEPKGPCNLKVTNSASWAFAGTVVNKAKSSSIVTPATVTELHIPLQATYSLITAKHKGLGYSRHVKLETLLPVTLCYFRPV